MEDLLAKSRALILDPIIAPFIADASMHEPSIKIDCLFHNQTTMNSVLVENTISPFSIGSVKRQRLHRPVPCYETTFEYSDSSQMIPEYIG